MLVITVAPAVGTVAGGGGGGVYGGAVVVGAGLVVGGGLLVGGGGAPVVVVPPGTFHDRVPAAPAPTRLSAVTPTSSLPLVQNVLPAHGNVSCALVSVVCVPRVPPVKAPLASTV